MKQLKEARKQINLKGRFKESKTYENKKPYKNIYEMIDIFLDNEFKEEVNIDKIIKDLQNNFSGSNENQMQGLELLKGLATSDDPKANEFMNKLDKVTTEISKEVLGELEEINQE